MANKSIIAKKGIESLDNEALKKLATEAFVHELGLDNSLMLEGNVEIRTIPPNTYLMKDESQKVNKYV